MIDEKILTFGRYYRDKLGVNVRKIPISISGFTCPNLDGTKAKGGCSFCENESFSPNLIKSKTKFSLSPTSKTNPIINNQLQELRKQYKKSIKNIKADKYIIYFQSFTNTYAPLDTLKILYQEALSLHNVIGISIGTRADSVNDEILIYLKELANNHEIWIEYGVQSIYDKTLNKINRAENSKDVLNTIKKSKNMGLMVCTHFIFGLPDETQDMMLATVKKTIDLEVDSIKIHPLYIVKNTLLGADFINNRFTPIEQSLYIDTLIKAIKMLKKDVIVQRVSAGIDDDTLLGPSWCRDKNSQMTKIREAFLKNGLIY